MIDQLTRLRDHLLLAQTYELCIVVAVLSLSSTIFVLFTNVLQRFYFSNKGFILGTHRGRYTSSDRQDGLALLRQGQDLSRHFPDSKLNLSV